MIGLAIKFFGQHAGLGVAQSQYAKTGRLTPRYLPSLMLEAFLALWSGAAVGPEGPLTFLSGGVGTFVADRLKIEKDDVPLLVYSSIAGAFGGFFGSPVVGAVGAFEYMFIHELDFYRHVIPGLLAASFGYGVYFALLHTSYLGIYSFPNYASPRVIDLGWAIVVGLIAGVVGILFQLIFGIVHLIVTPLKQRPVILAIAGGVLIGLVGSFLPLTLYSGQSQLSEIIHNPACLRRGAAALVAAGQGATHQYVVRYGLRWWSSIPTPLHWRHTGSGHIQILAIHSARRGCLGGYGGRGSRRLPYSPDAGLTPGSLRWAT